MGCAGETNPTFRAKVDVASFNFVFRVSYNVEGTFVTPSAVKKGDYDKQNDVSTLGHK